MSEWFSSLVFAAPWVLLLLPLPVLVRRFFSAGRAGGALRLPYALTGLAAGDRRIGGAARRSALLAGVAWCLLVVAAARPQWSQWPAADDLATPRRDVLLAIDLSASMAVRDLQAGSGPISRAEAARELLVRVLSARPGDRAGVIVFGSQAYVHTPLTSDRRAVLSALDEAQTGLAGSQTALGDALGLAVDRLRALPPASRAVLLVTDGASTAGVLSPERAAWLAAREGVRVHAVGIGSDRGLDEATLRLVAEQTGGSYWRVTEADALGALAGKLDALEPRAAADAGRPLREGYVVPLAGALLIALALIWRGRARTQGAP